MQDACLWALGIPVLWGCVLGALTGDTWKRKLAPYSDDHDSANDWDFSRVTGDSRLAFSASAGWDFVNIWEL